jgi:hypothetical protein
VSHLSGQPSPFRDTASSIPKSDAFSPGDCRKDMRDSHYLLTS